MALSAIKNFIWRKRSWRNGRSWRTTVFSTLISKNTVRSFVTKISTGERAVWSIVKIGSTQTRLLRFFAIKSFRSAIRVRTKVFMLKMKFFKWKVYAIARNIPWWWAELIFSRRSVNNFRSVFIGWSSSRNSQAISLKPKISFNWWNFGQKFLNCDKFCNFNLLINFL